MHYPIALVKAIGAILLVVVLGTVGYMLVEGWPLLDSFYMTVITLTTIGFGEVHPLSDAGRMLTVGVIVCGLGLVGYAVVAGTRFVIEGELNDYFTRRRSVRTIKNMQDHFVVCGFGRMGSLICRQLKERGIPFAVVEKEPETQAKIAERRYPLSTGDATDERVLLSAGIKHARGLVSVLDSDAANVYVVLTARELNPALEIVARSGTLGAHKRLLRAGADRVIDPYQIGGMRMVMGILKPAVMSFIEMAMDYKELGVEIEQIPVTVQSAYAGKTLIETAIRRELDLIIVAIRKKDGRMVFNPGPQTVVEESDILITMGEREKVITLRERAGADRQD